MKRALLTGGVTLVILAYGFGVGVAYLALSPYQSGAVSWSQAVDTMIEAWTP